MCRTACTEPQCLHKGDLYLYLLHGGDLRGGWLSILIMAKWVKLEGVVGRVRISSREIGYEII